MNVNGKSLERGLDILLQSSDPFMSSLIVKDSAFVFCQVSFQHQRADRQYNGS